MWPRGTAEYLPWVPLCPKCFNAPQWCECDPPFDGSGGIEPAKKWTPVRQASVDEIEAVIANIPDERRRLIGEVLTRLAGEGCWIEDPPARVRDYVNIRVPPSYGPARLASMNRSTGRIEFHDESFDIAIGVGLADRFDCVQSSNAAAITISDEAELDATVRLGRC